MSRAPGRPRHAGRHQSRTRLWACALALSLSWSTIGRAQAVRLVHGRITDPSQAPIAGVTVQLAGTSSAVTDDAGRFTIRTDTGAVILDIRRIGFRSTRYGVRAGGDTTVTVILLPAPQNLDPVD